MVPRVWAAVNARVSNLLTIKAAPFIFRVPGDTCSKQSWTGRLRTRVSRPWSALALSVL